MAPPPFVDQGQERGGSATALGSGGRGGAASTSGVRVGHNPAVGPVPEPAFPRIHLFRFPRRELALLAGAVGSAVLFARYGLSWSEGTLAAVPLVGGWVVSEVVGS